MAQAMFLGLTAFPLEPAQNRDIHKGPTTPRKCGRNHLLDQSKCKRGDALQRDAD